MTILHYSPYRNALRPAKVLVDGQGVPFTGDGFSVQGYDCSLTETIAALVHNSALDFADDLSLRESYGEAPDVFDSERAAYRETKAAFLNSSSVTSERTVNTQASRQCTLSTPFGNDGFGKLGFGGSLTING